MTREYVVARTDCDRLVRERITPRNVRTIIDGRTVLAVRVILSEDGRILYCPVEEFRDPQFSGDWLPWDFSLDDFAELVRLHA